MTPGTELLKARQVWKTFDRTHALAGADIDLAAGEVHALVGANGAGKSTFSRIVSGHIRPDRGEILFEGRPINFSSSRDAILAGIAIVMQETSLAPDLSVLENIFLPELGMPGRLSWKRLAERAQRLLDEFGQGHHLPLKTPVRELSIGQRQLIEIAKALARDSKLIIFDEPTASFSPHEVDRLFDVIRLLAGRGNGLIFVSHRLEEIFAIADRITVFREGKAVAKSVRTAEMTPAELIRLMVGRELSDVYAHAHPAPAVDAAASGSVIEVEHLASAPRVRDVSFRVGPGEIVGLAGLVGAGRSEIAEAIFGLRPISRGTIRLHGRPFRPREPIDAVRAGIGFIAEDRRTQGIIPDFSVHENLMLASLGSHRGFGTGYKDRAARASALLAELGLPERRVLDTSILNLSGGMQQKVILARWLLLEPRLLILDEPTRGVDIGTRSSIYAILRKIAAQGVGLLVISSDFEEVLGIADRVVVISDGADATDIPSAYLDVEKLAMFAAPRTSAESTHLTLLRLVERYGGIAYWAYLDHGRVFCFDSVGDQIEVDPGFRRGTFPLADATAIPRALGERSNAFVVEAQGDRASIIMPIRSARGHNLGMIGITLPGSAPLPAPDAVRRIIDRTMVETAPALPAA